MFNLSDFNECGGADSDPLRPFYTTSGNWLKLNNALPTGWHWDKVASRVITRAGLDLRDYDFASDRDGFAVQGPGEKEVEFLGTRLAAKYHGGGPTIALIIGAVLMVGALGGLVWFLVG